MTRQLGDRLVDLSHVIEEGMTTFKGFPGPHLCDYWTRDASAAHYDDGSSFQIGRIDMIANTGTYVDSPFHRYADGGICPNSRSKARRSRRPRGPQALAAASRPTPPTSPGLRSRASAVLVHTGWDLYWRTEAYFDNHPFLTAAAANWLVEQGAAFVSIDSHHIDDTRTRSRPVHGTLLGASIPIGEHLTNLSAVPDTSFRFSPSRRK